jgi:hypothetical protein
VIATAVQAIAAFNLICTGTMRTGPLGIALPEAAGAPFTITYRIDLASNRWCSDACEEIEPLASIVEGQILLRDRHEPNGSNVLTIIPATGRFTDTLIEGSTATLRSGTCEAETFTGFPVQVT